MQRITRIIGDGFVVHFDMLLGDGTDINLLAQDLKRCIRSMFSTYFPENVYLIYPNENKYEFFCMIGPQGSTRSNMLGTVSAASQEEAETKYRKIMSKIFRGQYPVNDLIEGRPDTIYYV